jgi:SAM-dependent methyltransferase
VADSLRLLMPLAPLPPEGFGDYALHRCLACALEFAEPMREPDAGFYKWLDGAGNYYPAERWEWTQCLATLRSRLPPGAGSAPVVLDVGCGGGRFLAMLGRAGYDAVGLDVSEQAVSNCLAQGLRAQVGSLADPGTPLPATIHAVTLWHVVEHVADPLAVLRNAREVLAPGGWIFFSVPLSPPSYEAGWTDPLNAPPHHLTRWNFRSLAVLADRLGMHMECVMPEAESVPVRLLRALVLQSSSPFAGFGRAAKLRRLARHVLGQPGNAWRELQRQRSRARQDGRVLPDVVLVGLRKD